MTTKQLDYPVDMTRVRGAIVKGPSSYHIFVVLMDGNVVRHEMPTMVEAELGFHLVYPDGYLIPHWVMGE